MDNYFIDLVSIHLFVCYHKVIHNLNGTIGHSNSPSVHLALRVSHEKEVFSLIEAQS